MMTTFSTGSQEVLIANALHAFDSYILRVGRRPGCTRKLLDSAIRAAHLLVTEEDNSPAIKTFKYVENFDHLPDAIPGQRGFFNPVARLIEVQRRQSDMQRDLQVVCHEMAHSILHAKTSLEMYYTDPKFALNCEVEAEATAVIAVALMDQVSPDAFSYLKSVISYRDKPVYRSIIDTQYFDRLFPAASQIVSAFNSVQA
jgi:hypothetical protein